MIGFVTLVVCIGLVVWMFGAITGHAPGIRDFRYTAKVQYLHTDTRYSKEMIYDITVIDKATGLSLTRRKGRYPHIYGNEKAWAREQSRNIYKELTASGGSSFTL